jgi:hypothetical protein
MIGFYGLNGYHVLADHVPLLHLVLDVATRVYDDVDVIAEHLMKITVPIDETDLPGAVTSV